MSDFKRNITSILADEAILTIKPTRSGFNYIVLKEDQIKATLKHLKLTHIKESDICITFDVPGDSKYKTYSPYLSPCKGHSFNSRCDFVVIRKEGGIWRVYFGDLKSEGLKVGNIVKQLSATKVFFDFILQLIRNEYGNEELIDYIPRLVCVHDNGLGSPFGVTKSTTIPGNSDPYKVQCQITKKHLIVMPVGVSSAGQARVSFKNFCSI